jgi:DnaJ homolog subfamily A member 5
MGASQSSAGGAGAEQNVKTSYYELLGVQRNATEDEIKKAYRRKALELHPDRNYGNEQEATSIFAEVQSAYEVLSDPQERAWYDSHESAILRGDDVDEADAVPTYENIRITTADDLARIVGRFNKNVEFSDAPSGFFGFLRETFQQLAKEEEVAANWEGTTDAPEYPTFGHKDDAYDDVVKRFYIAWSSFSTVKSFSWKDKYRLSEAPDRWYRRRMEQENKKYRQDAMREFNDAVRSLVAFVRKRDPRYVPSTQTEAERQKILRDAAAAQAARARAENEAKLHADVPEWTQSREPDPLAEMEGTFEEESEEEHVFECVACNKIFKSERQWEAHEKSKKHQKAVYALQKKMRKDDAKLDLDHASSGVGTPELDTADEEIAVPRDHLDNDEVDRNDDVAPAEVHSESDADSAADVEHETVATSVDAMEAHSDAESSEDSDYASPETVQARLAVVDLDKDAESTAADDMDNITQAAGGGKKIGKAAQKRAKRAAAAAATDDQADVNQYKCAGCDAAFPSKTRLFQHLQKQPGHAMLKTGDAAAKGKKGKRKK